MRLFFAIPLPERVQEQLARFQRQAKAVGMPASWPNPQGLHLTLAFLGEQEVSSIPALREVGLHAAARHPRFTLRTSQLGGFPKDRSARVLWLGLDEQPALLGLAADLGRGLGLAGLAFDDRPFKAHLTLARFKTPQDVARFEPSPAPMAFEAKELALFHSAQTPSGFRYVSMGSAPLGREAVG